MQRSGIKTLLIAGCKVNRATFEIFLRKDAEIDLVSTVLGGKAGVAEAHRLLPDVVITDLDMPGYDGVAVVREVMRNLMTPVIVLSGRGEDHRKVSEALSAGAFEVLSRDEVLASRRQPKPRLNLLVRAANEVTLQKAEERNVRKNTHEHSFDGQLSYEIIAIGASTGGPSAIEELLNALPANLSIPVVITQHMPASFLLAFAHRLDKVIPLRVKVADRGEVLQPGTVYIAPGHINTQVVRSGAERQATFKFTRQQYRAYNEPSIDAVFISIAKAYGTKAIGVVLTGMGKDGTEGLLAIQRKGGYTIAQDQASSVVFGMPKQASDSGAVQQVLPLREIPGFLVSCLS